METLVIVAVVVGWILCGLGSYGIFLANFWKEFPALWYKPGEWRWTRNFALICSLFGPGSLVVGLILLAIGKHGFMFRWNDPRG